MNKMKVLELGSYFSAPLLGSYLTKFGCIVTCIEKPDDVKSLAREKYRMGKMYELLKQDKRRVKIRLPDDKKTHNLLLDTNIVIENFGQNVMTKLGLGEDYCKSVNPRIVYLSFTPFKSEDCTVETCHAYFESVLMAMSGVFTDMGLNRTLLGIKASYSGLPLASVYGSMFGLMGLLAAFYGGCHGETIEVPLVSCLSEAMVHNTLQFDKDDSYINLRSRRLLNGEYPVEKETLRDLFDPFFCLYKCKDDRYFYLVCPAHARHQRKALRILQIEDKVLNIVGFKDTFQEDNSFGLGCGYLTEEQNRQVRPLFGEAFSSKTTVEWEKEFGEQGVPGARVQTTEEWKVSDHVRESGLFDLDKTKLANVGWLQEASDAGEQAACRSCDDTCTPSVPLKKIKVIDLTNVIAGPTIGTMMARFGADVIKIDPPQPTYSPDVSVFYGIVTNIGKKSLLLDVYDPQGYSLLVSMLQDADVLLVNCTHECLERMRLTKQHLSLINPNLILAHFDAWSGPLFKKGRMSAYNGYDDCVQASIGIMERFGGGLQTPEEHAHIGTIDVIAGVCGASSVLAALIERKYNKKIYVARTSLAAVGQYLQLPWMCGVDRKTLGSGEKCIGEHSMHACYEAQDGWFLMVASFDADDNRALQRLIGLLQVETLSRTTFLGWQVDDICRFLNENGVCACKLKSMIDIRENNIVKHFEKKKTFQFFKHTNHPVGLLTIVAPTAIRMNCILLSLNHAPKYGEHTRHILNSEHHKLASKQVIAYQWSNNYIPFVTPCQKCKRVRRKKFLLHCNHALCIECTLFSDKKCPICHATHEIQLMEQQITDIRSEYRMWRQGKSKGCKDLEYFYMPRSRAHIPHSQSLSDLNKCSHSIRCASFGSLGTLSSKHENTLQAFDR